MLGFDLPDNDSRSMSGMQWTMCPDRNVVENLTVVSDGDDLDASVARIVFVGRQSFTIGASEQWIRGKGHVDKGHHLWLSRVVHSHFLATGPARKPLGLIIQP